jgi:hypothetical protein
MKPKGLTKAGNELGLSPVAMGASDGRTNTFNGWKLARRKMPAFCDSVCRAVFDESEDGTASGLA